jgi:hypothetical protein
MQWGFDGKPTWYTPKAVGLWWIVAFAIAVRLLIWAASTYLQEPHGAEIGLLFGSVIFVVSHLITLRAALRAN